MGDGSTTSVGVDADGLDAEPAAIIVPADRADDPRLTGAVNAARHAGARIELYATESADDNADVLGGLSGSEVRTVIVAGGDGTLHRVIADWQDHAGDALSLAVLPMGTGNDFATAAGIPCDDLPEALRLALTAPVIRVDLALANDKPFINVATLGSPAEATAGIDPDTKRRFGKLAYACFGLMKIGQAQPVGVEATAGDWSWSGSCLGVMVANGRDTGGGFTVAPHGLMNDGRLDGVIIPELPIHDWLTVAVDMRAGQVDPGLSDLPAWQAAETRLQFDRPVQVNLDGEPMHAEQVLFSVVPGALRMRLPETAPTR